MPPPTLADLQKSVERRILEAYAVLVKADPILSAVFKPILIVESPTREALLNYAEQTMVLVPFQVIPKDWPSKRETTNFGIMTSAFLKPEPTDETSALIGLDLGNHIRKLAWSAASVPLQDTEHLTIGVPDVRQLTSLIPREGVKIFSYRTIYQADIDPSTGLLTG